MDETIVPAMDQRSRRDPPPLWLRAKSSVSLHSRQNLEARTVAALRGAPPKPLYDFVSSCWKHGGGGGEGAGGMSEM